MRAVIETRKVAPEIPGYTYGTSDVTKSPISMAELAHLKQSVGFTTEDEANLKTAGEVVADQTEGTH